MLALLGDVVQEASAAAGVRAIAVVTSDDDAVRAAAALGVATVTDGGLPWNEGLVHALARVPTPGGVTFLAADLPAVTTADVEALLEAAPPHGVAIARARDAGTNALVIVPPRLIVPSFGAPRSAAVHATLAAAAGAAAVVVDRPGLSLDLDTPEDLTAALAESPLDRAWRRALG